MPEPDPDPLAVLDADTEGDAEELAAGVCVRVPVGSVDAVGDVLAETTGEALALDVVDTLADGRADGVGMTKTIGAVDATDAGVVPVHRTAPVFETISSTFILAVRLGNKDRGRRVIFATGSVGAFATEKTIQLSASAADEQPSTAVPNPSVHTLQRVPHVHDVLAVHGCPIARSPPMSCTPNTETPCTLSHVDGAPLRRTENADTKTLNGAALRDPSNTPPHDTAPPRVRSCSETFADRRHSALLGVTSTLFAGSEPSMYR